MFCRRFPAHLVPGLEFAIDQYLQGALRDLKAPVDCEVVILHTGQLDTYLLTGEADERPIPTEPTDDCA